MECKICWYVYDPAEGDVVWQIAPGTPFAHLPPHWTCPNCSATKDQFLVLPDNESKMNAVADPPCFPIPARG